MAVQKLTEKQRVFCEEYLVDLNGTQAAIRAGYSSDSARQSASDLLSKPYIRAYLRKSMDIRSKKTLVDTTFVVNGLVEVANRCRQAVPVMTYDFATKSMVQAEDDEGNKMWQFDSIGANKALELLGKHTGAYEKDNEQNKSTIPGLLSIQIVQPKPADE